jgi:hypothetical protein
MAQAIDAVLHIAAVLAIGIGMAVWSSRKTG